MFEPVAFCPGYARGLAFAGHYAVVGLSLLRENRTFQGLPLDQALAARGAEPRCGLLVIDTRTGKLLHTIKVGRGPHGLCLFPQPGRFSMGHTGNFR